MSVLDEIFKILKRDMKEYQRLLYNINNVKLGSDIKAEI